VNWPRWRRGCRWPDGSGGRYARPFVPGSQQVVLLEDWAPDRFFPDLWLDVQSTPLRWRL